MTDVALDSVRIIGPGRAGRSFAAALTACGVQVDLHDRHTAPRSAAAGVDALLIATPDDRIADVAAAVEPTGAAVLHCSGATGLDALATHARRGSVHPLMALPDPATGSERLRNDGWFAVAGDPAAARIVELLGGRSFEVRDEDRALYHATAAISANHLVVLLGQVERLAAEVGVPLAAFLDLASGSWSDVVDRGAAAALTGPASRGDEATLARHRAALAALGGDAERELALYDALADDARRLGQT